MKHIVERIKEFVEDLEAVVGRHEGLRELIEPVEEHAPEPGEAHPPRVHTPLKNPSHQKGGRTLQGRDPTPGIKGSRPVLAPRLNAGQRKSTGSRRRRGQ